MKEDSKAFDEELNSMMEDQAPLNDDNSIDYSIPRLGLLRFLIFNGYLGEEFRFYTSIFYEQEDWTDLDEQFHKSVLEKRPLSSDHRIPNPKEVDKHLNIQDYSSRCILNYDLLKYLCESKSKYLSHIIGLLADLTYQNQYWEFIPTFLKWEVNGQRIPESIAKYFLMQRLMNGQAI